MRYSTEKTVQVDGREIACRLTHSMAAKRVRLKVSNGSLEIVVPFSRRTEEGISFLKENEQWAARELDRSRRRLAIRRPVADKKARVSYRGKELPVQVMRFDARRGPNRVSLEENAITVLTGPKGQGAVARSLENWLRKQAREQINAVIDKMKKKLKRSPNRIYVMGQRTKWGNCSSLGNLSFNWRLIMAPDFVLEYLVVHEFVHLAVPDHSQRFWLTVQSLCRDSERARRWLVANERSLTMPLFASHP